jgi:hypothetical protein
MLKISAKSEQLSPLGLKGLTITNLTTGMSTYAQYIYISRVSLLNRLNVTVPVLHRVKISL